MENMLSTNYQRGLVTAVHSLHQLKKGGHLTESEGVWPLLQIMGRSLVSSVWLECCSPLSTSLHPPHPVQLLRFHTSMLWAQLRLLIPSG